MHPTTRDWVCRIVCAAMVAGSAAGAWAQDTSSGVHEAVFPLPGAAFPLPGAAQDIRILSGDSVRLRWSDAGDGAVIIGLGPVTASGERLVTPENDTSYTLIAGEGPAARFRTIDVQVRGRKGRGVGNPDFPPLTEYHTTIDGAVAGLPYPALVERVYRYLQDTCGHQVESTHKPWEPDYTLWTNYAQPAGGRPRCLEPLPGLDTIKRPIAAAFFVRLSPAGKAGAATALEIGAVARFRYANEERWRVLDDPAVVKGLADSLRQRLEALK